MLSNTASNEGGLIEFTVCLFFIGPCQMIGMKRLQLFTQLHLSEQSWQRTAEHCSIFLSAKVATHSKYSSIFSFCTNEFLKVHLTAP